MPPKLKPDAKKKVPRTFKCSCVNEYQDAKYGKGIRVVTTSEKSPKCTVCGKAVTTL